MFGTELLWRAICNAQNHCMVGLLGMIRKKFLRESKQFSQQLSRCKFYLLFLACYFIIVTHKSHALRLIEDIIEQKCEWLLTNSVSKTVVGQIWTPYVAYNSSVKCPVPRLLVESSILSFAANPGWINGREVRMGSGRSERLIIFGMEKGGICKGMSLFLTGQAE